MASRKPCGMVRPASVEEYDHADWRDREENGDDPPVSRSEEHTSELQSLMRISYAVFCLTKKKIYRNNNIRKAHPLNIVTHITHYTNQLAQDINHNPNEHIAYH